MTTLSVSDMVAFVRAQIDEVQNSSDASFISSDNLSLQRLVETSVVAVVRAVHLSAPNVLLEGITPRAATTPQGGSGIGMKSFAAPEDFLRLVSLRMSDWSKPVQTLISEDSVEYQRQHNRYLRGTPTRPVAALVHRNGGGYTIEVYTSATTSMQHFYYVPEISFTNGNVTICQKLRTACLYAVTAEVMRCLGQNERAKYMDAMTAQNLNHMTDTDRVSPINGEKITETR